MSSNERKCKSCGCSYYLNVCVHCRRKFKTQRRYLACCNRCGNKAPTKVQRQKDPVEELLQRYREAWNG